MTAKAPRTAVIFRTHFWDGFAQRQFDRLLSVAEGTDVFVLVDETNGKVSGIEHRRVVRVTADELLAMGFARAGEGNLLWFNGDYPLYRFQELHPDYDYYVQLEYDVLINRPIAELVARLHADQVDFVGLTKGETGEQWFWRGTMAGAYPKADMLNQLICLCVFSGPALRHLWQARLAQSMDWQEGRLTDWPFCEGFIPSELARAGFKLRELDALGTTRAYDHWPPFLEADAPGLAREDFIHPVLDEPRFISSMQKYHIGLIGYLNPASQFHRKLRRLPPLRYMNVLVSSFAGKARRNLKASKQFFFSKKNCFLSYLQDSHHDLRPGLPLRHRRQRLLRCGHGRAHRQRAGRARFGSGEA